MHKYVYKYCRDGYKFIDGFEYECLVYFMTLDKYNSSSFFKPYYDYLPSFNKSDFIFDFSNEEIELFKGTGITEGIRNYNRFYKRAFEPVKDKLKEFAKEHNISFQKIIEDFKYNFNLVATRNFGRPESFFDVNTMVPYLDLINHSDKNNSYWFYEDADKEYTLIAGRDIEKNQEITYSYGHYRNSKLFEIYGFVIPGNIYHEYVNVDIEGEKFNLNLDFLNSVIISMFEKLSYKKKIDFDEVKKCILKSLIDKKNYYSRLRTNRFSMNVIIEEHINILNIAIEKVTKFKIK